MLVLMLLLHVCYALLYATHSRHARTTSTCNGHGPSTVHASTPRWMIPGSMDPGSPLWVSSSSHGLDASCDAILQPCTTLYHMLSSVCSYSAGAYITEHVYEHTILEYSHTGILHAGTYPMHYPRPLHPGCTVLVCPFTCCLHAVHHGPTSGPCGTTCMAHAYRSCTHIITTAIMVSRVMTHGSTWHPSSRYLHTNGMQIPGIHDLREIMDVWYI